MIALTDYLRPVPKDPMPTPVDTAAVQASLRRLVELIQILAPSTSPAVIVTALERCVLGLVTEELRARILERLRHFTPEEISAVEAMTAELARRRGDEPPTPDETA
jgi:hypothetical protein